MPAPIDIFRFEVFANSARGLIARPVMPNNVVAVKSNIASINYTVKDMVTGNLVTGALDPNLVMFDTAQTWKYDKLGFTFLWVAPGSLWPLADRDYAISVVFVQQMLLGGNSFIEAWRAATKDPLA